MPIVLVLAGFVGLLVLAAALVSAMRGVERLSARLVGLSAFRWFEGGEAPGALWQRLVVRLASAVAPFAVSACLFFVALVAGGTSESTTAVTVLPGGAAEAAGMRDGDKVLAIEGAPIQTFEEIRTRASTQVSALAFDVERAGQRMSLSVTPRAGRIGVSSVMTRRSVSLLSATKSALNQPLQVVIVTGQGILGWSGHTEAKGAVGIMRETGKAADAGRLQLLTFLGVLGAYFWPFIAALHVFDELTGWVFRSKADRIPSNAKRVARLRFSLHVALGCWATTLLLQAAMGLGVPATALLLTLAVPGGFALWPLGWFSLRELQQQGQRMGPLAFVGVLFPPIGSIWFALKLKTEEQRLRSLTG